MVATHGGATYEKYGDDAVRLYKIDGAGHGTPWIRAAAPAGGGPAGAYFLDTICSNYAHTTAGRAHQSGGYTYANGSNDAIRLWEHLHQPRSRTDRSRLLGARGRPVLLARQPVTFP